MTPKVEIVTHDEFVRRCERLFELAAEPDAHAPMPIGPYAAGLIAKAIAANRKFGK